MDIKIYNHGHVEVIHIPKKYEHLLKEHPLYKVVQIIKKDLEEKEKKKNANKN